MKIQNYTSKVELWSPISALTTGLKLWSSSSLSCRNQGNKVFYRKMSYQNVPGCCHTKMFQSCIVTTVCTLIGEFINSFCGILVWPNMLQWKCCNSRGEGKSVALSHVQHMQASPRLFFLCNLHIS